MARPNKDNLRVGDEVRSRRFWEVGTVISTTADRQDHPVLIRFPSVDITYTRDGKYLTTDEEPDLYWPDAEIVGGDVEPKRMRKEVFERWLNVYEREGKILHGLIFETKDKCDEYKDEASHIKTVHIREEMEVPE